MSVGVDGSDLSVLNPFYVYARKRGGHQRIGGGLGLSGFGLCAAGQYLISSVYRHLGWTMLGQLYERLMAYLAVRYGDNTPKVNVSDGVYHSITMNYLQ